MDDLYIYSISDNCIYYVLDLWGTPSAVGFDWDAL